MCVIYLLVGSMVRELIATGIVACVKSWVELLILAASLSSACFEKIILRLLLDDFYGDCLRKSRMLRFKDVTANSSSAKLSNSFEARIDIPTGVSTLRIFVYCDSYVSSTRGNVYYRLRSSSAPANTTFEFEDAGGCGVGD